MAENVTDVTNTTDLDLRGLPVWERPPLVREALDRLPSGATLTFITENEPRGLSATLTREEAGRVLVESRRVAHGLWRVRMTRQQALLGEQSAALVELRACVAFSSLDQGALEELAAAAIQQTGRRGQTLVEENDEWPFTGMVTEGVVVRAKGGEDERERILYEICTHELFGVAEYFDRGLANARISVLSKTARFVKFPWRLLDDIATRHPQLTTALGVVIAQRLRLMNDTLTIQGQLPILGRIARVLLPYAMSERGLAPAAPTLATITQSQIAAAAGTVKEVAARAIAELELRGVLKRERGHIRFLDREKLLELTKEQM
jgi:CRP-like cAMP-binding protein